jgi:hypothetical protein
MTVLLTLMASVIMNTSCIRKLMQIFHSNGITDILGDIIDIMGILQSDFCTTVLYIQIMGEGEGSSDSFAVTGNAGSDFPPSLTVQSWTVQNHIKS